MADAKISSGNLFSTGKKVAICFAIASCTLGEPTYGESPQLNSLDTIAQNNCGISQPSLLRSIFETNQTKNASGLRCKEQNIQLLIYRYLDTPYDIEAQSDLMFRNNFKKVQLFTTGKSAGLELDPTNGISTKIDRYLTTEQRDAPTIPTVKGFTTSRK